MAEFFMELYSEEIPPQLQLSARNQLKLSIGSLLKENSIKYKNIQIFSSPTRLTLLIKDLPQKIKTSSQEVRGPKVGSDKIILEKFAKSKNVKMKD